MICRKRVSGCVFVPIIVFVIVRIFAFVFVSVTVTPIVFLISTWMIGRKSFSRCVAAAEEGEPAKRVKGDHTHHTWTNTIQIQGGDHP